MLTGKRSKKLHIIIALITVIAILLSGTFAWQSISQIARNEMSFIKGREYGKLEIEKTVKNSDDSKLNELQKSLEFTFTVTFSDEGSYTYTIDDKRPKKLKSGDTLKLKHGETAVFEKIPVGVLYTVTETPVAGYITQSTGHRANMTKDGCKADFVNTCDLDKLGHLTITKEVRGVEGDLKENTVFNFKLVLDDETEHIFQLKHDGKEELRGLPIGTTYAVEEDLEDDRFTALVEKYEGQIRSAEEIQLPFINYYHEEPPTDEPGELIIKKIIDEENPDMNEAFTFNVSFTGGDSEIDGDTFDLTHGQEQKLINLPHGVTYTVRETETKGYWPVADIIKGKIVGGETAEVIYTNRKPDDGMGQLNISKEVLGEEADLSKEFHFELEIDGEKKPFDLKHKESKSFSGLRPGSKYTVTEIVGTEDGYKAAVESYSGVIAGDESILLPFINVHESENDAETGSLIFKKQVIGEQTNPDQEFGFEVKLEGEGVPEEPIKFKLKHNETKAFENLPIGTRYTAKEIDAGGYEAIVGEISGTVATPTEITRTFVNREPEEPENFVELTVTKKLKGPYPDTEIDRVFKMTLIKGDEEESFVLRGDESKTFQIPEGTVYEVREENYESQKFRQNIENGAGTATGEKIEVTVTNTYTGTPKKEVEGDPPIITKIVKGKNAPKTKFQFAFVGEVGAPMPEGSENAKKTLTLEGEGSVEIGKILFTKAGTYTYKVYEIKEDIKGWTYDTSRYTVTFEVKDEDDKLTCKRSITKGGEKAEKVSFVNTFDQDVLDGNVIISGKKTWDHGDNPAEKQPASIVINLYADGKLKTQRQVTAGDGWKYTFEVPSKNEEGKKIAYTIDEAPVANYKKTIDGYDVRNVYEAPKDDEPSKPSKPDKPTKPDKPDQSDQPDDTSKKPNQPDGQKKPDGSDTTDTGDHSYLGLWLLILIQSICLLFIFIYDKKRKLKKEGGTKHDS